MARNFDIAILLPTRGRSEMLERSLRSLIDNAANINKIQFLFGLDNDDTVGVDHFIKVIQPWLDQDNIAYSALSFEPLGYGRLNEYVNQMALASSANWLIFWNDDAIMETADWDKEIVSHTGEFKCLAVHTHQDHPYSIFPIVPREWLDVLGYLSPHQISDAWLSQQAYLLDIFERIPVWVTHDRHDLTGNNNDDTYKNRVMYEGNPNSPKDFHHISWNYLRMKDVDKLADYMRTRNLSTEWWENVKANKQEPWVKLQQNDINNQCKQFQLTAQQMGSI